MARKKKTGRRATDDQRRIPAMWIEMYEKARTSPGGVHCINPEDAWEERSYIRYDDPSPLLSLLKCFAEYGTFVDPIEKGVDEMLTHDAFSKLRSTGVTYQEAVARLAEDRHCSISTIERIVRRPQKVSPTDGD